MNRKSGDTAYPELGVTKACASKKGPARKIPVSNLIEETGDAYRI